MRDAANPRPCNRPAVLRSEATASPSGPTGARAPSARWHRVCTGRKRARIAWCGGIPTVLTLNVEETVGLRQRTLLEVDEKGTRSEQGIAAHAAWQRARTEVRAAGARAERRGGDDDGVGGARGRRRCDDRGARRSGRRRRRAPAWHSVSERSCTRCWPPSISMPGMSRSSASRRCKHASSAPRDDERAAATEATLAALAHPLLRRAARAARAGACRRETPVALRLDGGTLIEGVVDVAFRDGAENAWTVVDFKTDVEIGERLGRVPGTGPALCARRRARDRGGRRSGAAPCVARRRPTPRARQPAVRALTPVARGRARSTVRARGAATATRPAASLRGPRNAPVRTRASSAPGRAAPRA